jgi:hypothetical protein
VILGALLEIVWNLDGFTADFKHRITSGPIKDFNNQIARLIHLSF